MTTCWDVSRALNYRGTHCGGYFIAGWPVLSVCKRLNEMELILVYEQSQFITLGHLAHPKLAVNLLAVNYGTVTAFLSTRRGTLSYCFRLSFASIDHHGKEVFSFTIYDEVKAHEFKDMLMALGFQVGIKEDCPPPTTPPPYGPTVIHSSTW